MSSSLFKQVIRAGKNVGNQRRKLASGRIPWSHRLTAPETPLLLQTPTQLLRIAASETPLLLQAPTSQQQSHDGYPDLMCYLHWLSVLLVGTCYATVLAKKLFKAWPELCEKWPELPELLMRLGHKPVGVSLLTLLIFFRAPGRVYYHLAKKMPAHLPGPKWQQQAGDLAHITFYPVLGLLTTTGICVGYFKGKPVPIWNFFDIPCSQEPDKKMEENSRDAHKLLGDLVLPLMILMHVGAVKYHSHLGHQPIQRIVPRMTRMTRMTHMSLMPQRSLLFFSNNPPPKMHMQEQIKQNSNLESTAEAKSPEQPEPPSSITSCKF